MFDALKAVWEESSDNFYANWQRILFFLYTFEYVRATGDLSVWGIDV